MILFSRLRAESGPYCATRASSVSSIASHLSALSNRIFRKCESLSFSASISSSLRLLPSFLASLMLLACIPMLTFSRAQAQTSESKHLLIYTIDVEGGQSTLLVSPSGASMSG